MKEVAIFSVISFVRGFCNDVITFRFVDQFKGFLQMSLSKNSKALKRTVFSSKVREPEQISEKNKCVGLERREASNGQFEKRESAEQPLDQSYDGIVDQENRPP